MCVYPPGLLFQRHLKIGFLQKHQVELSVVIDQIDNVPCPWTPSDIFLYQPIVRQVIFKLSLRKSESVCIVPMLCFACPKWKQPGSGDSGSPVIVEGTDGSHTLVGVLGGIVGLVQYPVGEKVMYSAEVSGKSQSNVINKKIQTGKNFFL